MPHDLSRSSTNSASSSALSYTYGTPRRPSLTTDNSNNNHFYPKDSKKIDKMDISEDDDDDDDKDKFSTGNNRKEQKKLKQNLDRSLISSQKQSIINADMIFYCFEILGNYLFNGKHHLGKHHSFMSSSLSSTTAANGHLLPSAIVPPLLPSEPYPLFVTWLIGSEQKLRGCIGTFTPMNLAQGNQSSDQNFVFRIVQKYSSNKI